MTEEPREIIVEDDKLYRRLVSFSFKPDGTVSSAAFKNSKGKPDPSPSVDLARFTTPQESLERGVKPGLSLGSFFAVVAFSLELEVNHNPQQDNYSHCVLSGDITKSKIRTLAKSIIVEIRATPKNQL